MKTNSTNSTDQTFHTKREAAEKCRVSVRTFEARLKEGTVPYVKFGRRILIPSAALEKWVAAHTIGGV